MRASRLVQMLLLLQTKGRTTAARLAEELEVSVRTIYRDVEALSSSGVPIYAESGPGGGIQLIDGYQTKLTGLTAPEASALALAGVPDVAAQLGLGSVLLAAQTKVDAALPPELRRRAGRLRERFLIDSPGWFRQPEDVPALAQLSEAVWEGRRVTISYQRSDRAVQRTIDPLGLVLKAGIWYLLARAGRRGDVRTYRVSRVASVRTGSAAAARPDGFDLAETWSRSNHEFDVALRHITARVLLPKGDLWRLRYALSEPAAAEALDSVGAPQADGRCVVTIRTESLEVGADELLRLGARVEVLEPEGLRAELARIGRGIATLNEAAEWRGAP